LTADWNRQNFSGSDPESHPVVVALRKELPSAILEVGTSCGEVWAVVASSESIAVLAFLRDAPEFLFDFLSDLTAVHWPKREGAEFEIIYQLYSISRPNRFRIKVRVAEGESTPTATGVWKTADWLEREAYDMFGIRFEDHPDPRRILNPDNFEGYPLRKEFPLQGRVRW